MRRRVVYAILVLLGLLGGPVFLVTGDNCSAAWQPPFIECPAGGLSEPLILGMVFALVTLSIAGAIDLAWQFHKGTLVSVSKWRRRLYGALLVLIAVPLVVMWIQQAAGGYSSDGQVFIFVLGTWLLTLPILVDFIAWTVRGFHGAARIAPVTAVGVVAVGAYLLSRHPELGCFQGTFDSASCYTAMELYIAHYVAFAAMVTAFSFWGRSTADT